MTGTLIGLGPGWGGVAVDGSYVRVFGEGGLLGLVAFLYLCGVLLRRFVGSIRYYVIALLVTGLFIDIFVSLKPMMLLWALVGAASRPRILFGDRRDLQTRGRCPVACPSGRKPRGSDGCVGPPFGHTPVDSYRRGGIAREGRKV